MKKVVLSLFLAIVCLPIAFAQSGSRPIHTVSKTSCGPFKWIDSVTYTTTTVAYYETDTALFILDLIVNQGVVDTDMVTDINGTCFASWHGKKIFKAGTQLDTIKMADGCDSIVKLNVVLTGFNEDELTKEVCGQYKSTWDSVYKTSGTYVFTDSVKCKITTLDLTVNPIYKDSAHVVVTPVTAGCYYRLGDSVYNDLNKTHMNYLKSSKGCDSLVAIRITSFTNQQYDTTVAQYCGDTYKWALANNAQYTVAGEYDTLMYSADSVCEMRYHLNLIFYEKDTVIVDGPYCAQKTFDFRNNASTTYYFTATESGVWGYHADTTEGYQQDSSLYTMNLGNGCITRVKLDVTILQPEERYQDTIDTTYCNSFKYKFNGKSKTYTHSGEYELYDHKYSDDIVSDYSACYNIHGYLKLTLKYSTGDTVRVTACDSYTWHNVTYTRDTLVSGVLKDSANHNIKNIQGCDSVGRMTLTINRSPVAHIEGEWMLQAGDTTVLRAVSDMDDVRYRWYVDGAAPEANNKDSLVVVVPADEPGNISVQLITTATYSGNNSCADTSWLTITARNLGIDESEDMQVSIYPNPASRFVSINSPETLSEIVVYNAIGQRVLQNNEQGNTVKLDLSQLSNGSYTMSISTANGASTTRKLIIKK